LIKEDSVFRGVCAEELSIVQKSGRSELREYNEVMEEYSWKSE
jgi:hypothetical protein